MIRYPSEARTRLVPLFLGLLVLPAPLPAGESIPGVPGDAVLRADLNFRDLVQRIARSPAPPPGPPAVHPRLPVPRGRLLPGGAALRMGALSSLGGSGGATSPSPEPSASFLALADDGLAIPPDTTGAVGPAHLMVTLNTQVRIQDRQGSDVSTVLLTDFWQSLANPQPFDPRVIYDPYTRRWIFAVAADPPPRNSALLVAASKTEDPTGSWYLYRIDVDPANRLWLDYPQLGYNKTWVAVTGNIYRGDSFVQGQIYVFDKAKLLAGVSGPFRVIAPGGSIGGSLSPVITHDPSTPVLYLLQDYNGNLGGQGYLRTFSITGAVGSEVLNVGDPLGLPDTWDSLPPGEADFAPQLGSGKLIQLGDASIQQPVFRNGTLWGAQTVFLPAGGSAVRSAVQWWQISPLGEVLQFGRIDDPGGLKFYAYPSLDVNDHEDVLIGYSRFSASQYPSANYSFRLLSDVPNTLRTDKVLKEGEAPYFKDFGGGSNRWGDYSSTMVDPLNDRDLWTIQEYAARPSGGVDRWSTWWGRVTPPGSLVLFRRGDANGDGALDLTDAIAILFFLFLKEPPALDCAMSADADSSSALDLTDVVFLLQYLFLNGPAPGQPFKSCASDPDEAQLNCKSFPPCGPPPAN